MFTVASGREMIPPSHSVRWILIVVLCLMLITHLVFCFTAESHLDIGSNNNNNHPNDNNHFCPFLLIDPVNWMNTGWTKAIPFPHPLRCVFMCVSGWEGGVILLPKRSTCQRRRKWRLIIWNKVWALEWEGHRARLDWSGPLHFHAQNVGHWLSQARGVCACQLECFWFDCLFIF